jgi:YhcH/YjgK/YiaL family protein
MILCNISNAERLRSLSPKIAIALDWVNEHLNDSFEKGRIDIDKSNDIYVNCQEVAMVPREKSLLEAHRRYIDIHIPLRGEEAMGWAPISCLTNPCEPYNEDNDIEFYGDASRNIFVIQPGQLAILFPEDAHAPNIGIGGNHRKLCIKIPVD